MDMNPVQTFKFSLENSNGQQIVCGEIKGETDMQSLDDLKLKAVIGLLNSVDKQNFTEMRNEQLLENYLEEIVNTIQEMKKHNQFQGKTTTES